MQFHRKSLALLCAFLAAGPPFQALSVNSDLQLTGRVAKQIVTANELIVCTLGITNAGPGTANSVVLTNWLPAGVTLFAASASQGTLTTNAGSARFSIGTLSSGAGASAQVTFYSGTPGVLTNRAAVSSASNDPQPGNNIASNFVAVGSPHFQPSGSMNLPRKWHTATLLPNGQVLVAGGRSTNGNTHTSELFDPATGTFSFTGDTLGVRVLHAACGLTNGKVLVVGSVPMDKGELYDPVSGTWSYTGNLAFPRAGGHAMSALNDGRVLLTGGYQNWTDAEVYLPGANTWASVGPMSFTRQDHASVTLTNGNVLLIGGSYAGTNADLFNPASNGFAPAGGVALTRALGVVVRLTNNTVLLAGGYAAGSSGGIRRTAELYNPLTQSAESTGQTLTERWDLPGALLPDGRVLLPGGAGNYLGSDYDVLLSAEIFDPVTKSFTPAIPMNFPRRNHTATRLADGRILIIGGYHSSPTGEVILASAEIYNPAVSAPPATLSIADATTVEGNSGSNALSFNVTLSVPMGVPVSVNYAASPDTAQSGTDFSPATGTIIFPPGTTNQQIVISILGDATCEPDETFGLALAGPTNAILFRGQAVGTLLNDDPLPVITVSSAGVPEGDLVTSELNFTVTLSNPSYQEIQADYYTTNGTAAAGVDYQAATGGVIFPAGTTTQVVVVAVNGDITIEPDETLQLALSSPVNATLGTNGTGTITNDDGLPGGLHHFEVGAIASPQFHQVLFPLTVTARDVSNGSAAGFNGPVMLRALSGSALDYLFDMEQDPGTNWISAVTNTPYASGFGFGPYDVIGQGVISRAMRIVPFFGWSYGVKRDVALTGGVTYHLRYDAAQDNANSDPFFDYRLVVGTDVLVHVPMNGLGLPHNQVDRRSVSGSYTAPSNGTYTVTMLLSAPWSAVYSSVYVDNLRIEPAGVTPASVMFTNSVWTGPVQVAGQGTNLILQALAYAGHAGLSNPFELRPTADLAVTNTFSFTNALPTFTGFTLLSTLINFGSITATDVVFTNILPAGCELISANTTAGSCTNFGNTVVCTLTSLAVGDSATITLNARTGGEEIATNQTRVVANEVDHDTLNNVANTIFAVLPPQVFVAGSTVTETPGGANATFTIWLASSNNVPVSVDFATTNLSANAGSDYQLTAGTMNFPPGVTNQTFTVYVLDDLTDESDETFRVQLANPSHASLALATATATIVDDDPPPALALHDTSVLEGDSGLAAFVFNVSLSPPSEQWATVAYTTAPGTAQAVTDYLTPAPGSFVSFPPGTTNQTITISVRGNTVNEPDETFSVLLVMPTNATLARAEATGTILNDDAVAGRLDHFVFDPMAEVRRAQIGFPIRVSAVDAFGVLVTNYTGAAQLTAPDALNPGIGLVTPGLLSNFNQGVWTGAVAVNKVFTNGTLLVQDDAEHVGQSEPFKVLAVFPLTLSLPASRNENAGTLTNVGTLTTLYTNDTDIELFVSSGNTNLLLAGNAIFPAGETNAAFDLTVLDDALLNATRTVSVSATGPGFATNSAVLKIHDNEVATLTVTMSKPGLVVEGADRVQFQLGISPPPDTGYQVFFTSSDTTELTVPSNMGCSAGTTSAVFTATIINDTLIDGPQPVTVTAHVENWVDGVSSVTVLDNESTNLSLVMQWQGPYIEGTTITNFRRVQISGTLPTNLVVQLASSDSTELTTASTATILAGATFTNFSATLPDDDEFDGTQNVTVTASAPGFGSATNLIPVSDNDPHHLVFSGITSPRTSAVPFQVNLSVRDVNDVTLLHYGSLSLSAVAGNRTLPLTPSGGTFSRGLWSGSVTVNSWGTNVQLRAATTNGTFSLSAPFSVVPSPWSGPPAIMTQDGYFGLYDDRFGFNVRADDSTVVVVEASTNLFAWTPVHTNVLGTWELFFFDDLNSAQFPRRFYRARLHEGPLPPPSLQDAALATGPASLFSFNLTGVSGQGVVIEASTNLLDWSPLQTNTLGSSPLYFSDPQSLQSPQRFYRLRVK